MTTLQEYGLFEDVATGAGARGDGDAVTAARCSRQPVPVRTRPCGDGAGGSVVGDDAGSRDPRSDS
jgi:hypothetical protein